MHKARSYLVVISHFDILSDIVTKTNIYRLLYSFKSSTDNLPFFLKQKIFIFQYCENNKVD